MIGHARRFLTRWTRDRRGATAVEFAIIALPFVTLLFAVFELGLTFLLSTSLENALDATSRRIRTGQMQAAGVTAASFKQAVCDEMGWTGAACSSDLQIDMRTFANFSGMSAPDPVKNGKFDPTVMQFQPGAGGSIVLVRAFYQSTLVVPSLNTGLVNLGGGKRLISVATAFRNEPF